MRISIKVMDNFSNFFNSSKERFTPNTRVHHQNTVRGLNRKSQNQVARRYGWEGKKDNPIIDSIVKNNKIGKWNIGNAQAMQLLKTYRINHIPNKDYTKAINKTGISISFDSKNNKFFLSREK
jgi:hypothetical protein